MPDGAPVRDALQGVLEGAESQLASVDASPYSARAFSLLKEKIEEYVVELVSVSIRLSRRHRADTVSEVHVQQASDFLIEGRGRRFFRHLGTIGGILLGASISILTSMIQSAKYDTGSTSASVVFGIVGAFLIALHIAKD